MQTALNSKSRPHKKTRRPAHAVATEHGLIKRDMYGNPLPTPAQALSLYHALVRMLAREHEVMVCERPDLEPLGRCHYLRSMIEIREDLPPQKKVLTLCHEAGHWLSYLEHRTTLHDRTARERLAYEYGWNFIEDHAIDRIIPVNEISWQHFNHAAFYGCLDDGQIPWT